MSDLDEELEQLRSALASRYRIVAEVGRGGMATVYLAEDLRHSRRVALKVLRPALAAAVGRDRFLHEIRIAAVLSHPHILPLHDSGEADGFLYYVMPYVEGESLRDRLARERQLPIAEAVRIAREVADALAYAHDLGVVHRDIKPGNILVQRGHALVADFGIALAVSTADANRVTEAGLSLGTPSYMSPEQASGERNIDARSDVYSLGAVLYEMLTGEPPHTGPTVRAIIGGILTANPVPPSEVRRSVPPALDAATLKALEKLPADRFSSAAEFAASLGAGEAATPLTTGRARRASAGLRRAVPWLVSGVSLAIAFVSVLRFTPQPASVERWQLVAPDTAPVAGRVGGAPTPPAISADGRRLVFTAVTDSTTMLFVAQIGATMVEPLAGTQGGYLPFFSPDGEWIGFAAGRQIRKLELATGRVVVLHDGMAPWSAAWTDGGEIALMDQAGLAWLRESGGVLRRAPGLTSDSRSDSRLVPVFLSALPGTGRVLTTDREGRIAVISPRDGDVAYLTTGSSSREPPALDSALTGVWPRYIEPGFIIFWRPGAIMLAVRFDKRSLRVHGPPVEMMRGVRTFHVGTSPNGTWAYAPELSGGDATLVEVDRSGAVRPVSGVPVRRYHAVSNSPDGRYVALRVMTESGRGAVETRAISRGRATSGDRLMSGRGGTPRWDPRSQYVVADSLDGWLYRRNMRTGFIDSTRVPLERDESFALAEVLTPDSLLCFIGPVDAMRLVRISWEDPGARSLVLETAGSITEVHVSPTRRWVAYTAIRSGVNTLVVEPWPPDGRRSRVATAATQFAWDDDDFLYFLHDGWVKRSRPTITADAIALSAPEPILDGDLLAQDAWQTFWPTPRGQSLLVLQSAAPATARYLTIVRNWGRELERRLR